MRTPSICALIVLATLFAWQTDAGAADARLAKSSVPAEDAQIEATKLIREVYGTEYAEAKTAEKKTALAEKMIEKGVQSQDNVASQYVLFKTARDIAAQAGDETTTFQAIEQLDRLFQIDVLAMKATVLPKVVKAARQRSQNKLLAEQLASLIDDAVAVDRLDVASELCEIALTVARKAKDNSVLKQAQNRKKEVQEIVQAAEEIHNAKKTLDEKPDDPTANSVVGKYLCFLKGSWDKGSLC